MLNSKLNLKASFGAFFVLILVFSTAHVGLGQGNKAPITDRAVFVKEMTGLLKVGLNDKQIVAYWDKKGWPESIRDIDFVMIRNAKASPKLLKRLRKLLEGHAVLSELAEKYEPFEILLNSGEKLSLLRPRGWHQTQTVNRDRFFFHEHSAELPGWFRRTSFFVWVIDGGTWKKRNEKALTRIVLAAAKKRLIRAGLTVGTMKEERLLVKRGHREFPVIEAICRDPRDKLKGTIAMSVLVQEPHGKVIVFGYSTRLNPDVSAQRALPRDILAEMLSTVRITKKK